MSLEGLSEQEIQRRERILLDAVQALGGSAGNITLIHRMGWAEEQYWSLRDRLVDSGSLQLGRGRGGSVRLLAQAPIEQPAAHRPPEPAEAELYEPMARVLRERWVRDQRFGQILVENTARQGRRETGGTWTRPDLVVASLTTLLYVPRKIFDLVTFEVKPWNGLDVTAVYEALAHYRAATRSYVLAHVPEARQAEEYTQRLLERICDEAEQHGVGVIVAGRPDDYETWEERVEARFREPPPHSMNDFVSLQLSDGAKDEIARWFR